MRAPCSWLSKNWIIIKKDNINISQGKLMVKTDKLTKARENAGDQTTFGPPFTFDWLRGWRQFLDQTQSEVKQRQSNPGFFFFRFFGFFFLVLVWFFCFSIKVPLCLLLQATLSYPDCAEVVRRWIEHLSSTHTSQQVRIEQRKSQQILN